MVERRLQQQRSWLETADLPSWPSSWLDVMVVADGTVRTAAFAFLLRLGPGGRAGRPPAGRYRPDRLGLLWGRNNALRLPRELTAPELAEVTTTFVPALADLQAQFLDPAGRSGPSAGTMLDGDSDQAVLLRRLYGIGDPLSDAERRRLTGSWATGPVSRRGRRLTPRISRLAARGEVRREVRPSGVPQRCRRTA
jgi:hypothetical protein